ncbi:MAG: porin family protein [Prevotellaceae bacterium]|nr:porin family protein [Prevotellaceae bacterium]
MKRILLIFIAIMFFGNIDAQLRFGLKAGVNFSKFNTKEQVLQANGTAWQVGLASQFKIPVVGLGIQPELLYSVSKGKDNSIGYFNIPINIRWQPLPIPLIKPIILAGPYFGYAVNYKGFDSNIKRLDWGVGLGAGVEIWKFQIEGRYNWGLQNLSKVRDFKLKNNVVTVSAIYFF